MPIEVELKFPLGGEAPTAPEIVERLEKIGARGKRPGSRMTTTTPTRAATSP